MALTSKFIRLPNGELGAALRASRGAIVAAAVASGLMNLLMLAGPLFMLQVYDRVLPSRSLPTLVGLFLLIIILFAFLGLFEALRGRLLTRVGRAFADTLSTRVFQALMTDALQTRAAGDDLRPLRDVDAIRNFLSSNGLAALFDMPWVPLYIGVCFAFHPLLGLAVLGGAVVLCSLALFSEGMTRKATRDLLVVGAARNTLGETARRNVEVVHALGMRGWMEGRWLREGSVYLDHQQRTADVTGGLGSVSHMMRMTLQSGVLALGAYLVIMQEASAGIMLAAAVVSVRALAPVELAIANWRSFIAVRQSWARLHELLTAVPSAPQKVRLPAPTQTLRLTALSLVAPGSTTTVLHDVNFSLAAGSALGVIGPSGSGKSSLARALAGAWAAARGVIRLDNATLDQWEDDHRGRFIGYLPQDIELFTGTVAENITRFDPNADPDALIAAARAAGVHDTILRLPKGYEMEVGEAGRFLSGGQRQRIALARALYGEPFLVILDEPNSNLDAAGDKALAEAIGATRARGGIVILIAHRPSALAAVDQILVLNEGHVHACGPREKILPQLMPTSHPAAPAAAPTAASIPQQPVRSMRRARNRD
jgi:PrtD family type I secretion system ABC transporter